MNDTSAEREQEIRDYAAGSWPDGSRKIPDGVPSFTRDLLGMLDEAVDMVLDLKRARGLLDNAECDWEEHEQCGVAMRYRARLEAAEAQVATLTAERDEWRAIEADTAAQRDEARAEVARLREQMRCPADGSPFDYVRNSSLYRDLAEGLEEAYFESYQLEDKLRELCERWEAWGTNGRARCADELRELAGLGEA